MKELVGLIYRLFDLNLLEPTEHKTGDGFNILLSNNFKFQEKNVHPKFAQDELRIQDINHPDLYAFPFAKGPQSCIGRWIAMREVRLIVGYVLENYELKSTGRNLFLLHKDYERPATFIRFDQHRFRLVDVTIEKRE